MKTRARKWAGRAGVAAGAALCALLCAVPGGCALSGSGNADGTVQDSSVRLREAQRLSIDAREAEKAGDTEKALLLYRQAVTTYPEFHAAWHNMGALLFEQRRMDEAKAAFQSAADLAPADPRPMAGIGMIYQELLYPQQALDAYLAALDRNPNYLPALREAVVLELTLNKVTDATATRVRTALLVERDPKWREDLLRRKLLIDQYLSGPSAFSPR